MDLLPVLKNLHGQLCSVTGSSRIAFQKIQLFIIIAVRIQLHFQEKLCNEVEKLLQQNLINLIQTNLEDLDLRNYNLIIATSEDFDTNRSIAALAQKNNTPVNTVDHPEQYSFLLPSILDRSPLIVAVSNGGKSMTLSVFSAKNLQIIGRSLIGPLVVMLREFRNGLNQFIQTYKAKKAFWLRMIFPISVVELFLSGKRESARKILIKDMEFHKKLNPVLVVSLVPETSFTVLSTLMHKTF